MRKFGLIGGTSWMSTIEYYKQLNQAVNQCFKSNVNPPLYLSNLNQNAIQSLQDAGDWQAIANILIEKCRELESIGCEGLAFCANTPHRVYQTVQDEISIDILHIGESIGRFAKRHNFNKLGLLGTRITMDGQFIKQKISDQFSIDVMTPSQEVQMKIHQFLREEMSQGIFSQTAKAYFNSVIDNFKSIGAEAVILGCTEFPILLDGIYTSLPKIDSIQCHTRDIVDYILRE